jgi:aminoglycoside 6'-N-acetyltransferase
MNAPPTLAPVRRENRDLIRSWLMEPVIYAFWGSAAAAEAEVRIALESSTAISRMIVADGQLIGYAHSMDCALLGLDHAAVLAPGTWDCALFVASEAHRGRGAGTAALGLLVAEVFGSTLAPACVIRVPVAREAQVRAVEAAGFRWLKIEADPALGPVWVMQAERP